MISAYTSPDGGTKVPSDATQWVQVEHLEMDHGPSEAPLKPRLGAMELYSCLLELKSCEGFGRASTMEDVDGF